MKKIILFVIALFIGSSSFALTPILGPSTLCTGETSYMRDTTTGGTWTSSNTAVATISSVGIITGIAAGTTTITYTLISYVTKTVTVTTGTMPAPITGITSLCVGATTTLTDATTGGVWSSINPSVATVGTPACLVTGMAAGLTTIQYTVGGCSVGTTVTVTGPPSPIYLMGAKVICIGSIGIIADSGGTTSGSWASSNTAVATVSGGTVSALTLGTSVISYTLTGTCGSKTGTRVITTSSTTAPGTISGTLTTHVGATTILTETEYGGTWTSSNTSVATMDAATGAMTGISAGIANITYTISGCGGMAYAVTTVTITPFDGISGYVRLIHASSADVKVYLITYNPATFDLQAVDSVSVSSGDSSVYYEFASIPTDSFRIKAAPVTDTLSIYLHFGNINAYHNSSFYWHAANVIHHITGTADINKDITLPFGTMLSGPGFVGGNVYLGANKGTSAGDAVGLGIFLLNSAGAAIGYTKTDASGHYSFSGLTYGNTYEVFPELLNYITTPRTVVASSTPPVASFIQHTISHTITPIAQGVIEPGQNIFVSIYPNPANDKFNIRSRNINAEKGTITLSELNGKKIYTADLQISKGVIAQDVDVASIANGFYIINIQAGATNVKEKIEVLH